MAYIHIPVEWERPGLHRLEEFFGTLKAFEGRKIRVHCARNMRVSAFVYLYRRLRLGDREDDASHPMRAVWVPNETWLAFIRDALSMRTTPGGERDARKRSN